VAQLTTNGPWDAVVDTNAYVPREALALARRRERVVDRFVLVSALTGPLTDVVASSWDAGYLV
jgi:2'-hydroxyisoflavone reductase